MPLWEVEGGVFAFSFFSRLCGRGPLGFARGRSSLCPRKRHSTLLHCIAPDNSLVSRRECTACLSTQPNKVSVEPSATYNYGVLTLPRLSRGVQFSANWFSRYIRAAVSRSPSISPVQYYASSSIWSSFRRTASSRSNARVPKSTPLIYFHVCVHVMVYMLPWGRTGAGCYFNILTSSEKKAIR